MHFALNSIQKWNLLHKGCGHRSKTVHVGFSSLPAQIQQLIRLENPKESEFRWPIMEWHGKYLHDNRNLQHFNFNISKDKGNFTATMQKIYPFLFLLIVPRLNGSHVNMVPDVKAKTGLWNLKVLNANTPARWKLALLHRTNIWAFFGDILHGIIVISSHILILCTYSLT